jgi:hypothetical protein
VGSARSDAPCALYGDLRISGQVPSFDGTLLDADLTFPISPSGPAATLFVLLHGFGNDKHEWQSTTDDADKQFHQSHSCGGLRHAAGSPQKSLRSVLRGDFWAPMTFVVCSDLG